MKTLKNYLGNGRKNKEKTRKYLLMAGLILGVALIYLFHAPASIVNVGTYAPNINVADDVSATATGVVIDNDHSDGTMTVLYGSWVIYHDGVKVAGNENAPVELTTNTYSHSINQPFSDTGKYIHAVAIAKATNQVVNDEWAGWISSVVSEEKHEFTVGYPAPSTSPLDSVITAFMNFINAILALFGL